MNATTRFSKHKASPLPGCILKGLLLTLPCAAALLLLSAFVALRFPDPGKAVMPLGYCSVAFSSLLCGIFTGKRAGAGAVGASVLAGVAAAALLFLLSLILGAQNLWPFPASLLFYPGVVLLAALGGMLCSRKKKNRRYRR